MNHSIIKYAMVTLNPYHLMISSIALVFIRLLSVKLISEQMGGKSFLSVKVKKNLCFLLKRFICNEANIKIKEFKIHQLKTSPPRTAVITREDATHYYKEMITIRQLEAAVDTLFKQDFIRGFCHLQTGQEASAVGIKSAVRSIDSVISGYRVHGWAYLMGNTISEIAAELLGKQSGSSKGKGGSMHIYGKNFYGGNGIVGAQVPLGVGIAFAAHYQKSGGLCFILFGDGASKQGQVHEAFNMAKLWKLPCIFVCENNDQAVSLANTNTATSGRCDSTSHDYYSMVNYIPGIWVDGTDVLAVREACRFSINHYETFKEPILLELYTPCINSTNSEEINNINLPEDPIVFFKHNMLMADLSTEEELKIIEETTIKEVEKLITAAKIDCEPDLTSLTTDVYAHCLEKNIRSIRPKNY